MERATIKRAKSRIDGSVRLASVLLSPLNHAITAERCLASPLGFQTSPIAPVDGPKCQEWVCAVTRRRFPVGASPTRQPLQPEATGAGMEATKCLKPSGSGSRIGDRASVQAATRVNAEQASKRSMCRPTRPPNRGRLLRPGEMSEDYAQPLHRGSGGSMYTRKAHATREAPLRDQG